MSASLGLGAAALALGELDVASLGQFMISRPIVLGPAAGALVGEPWLGVELGIMSELLGSGDAPMGGHAPLNVAVVLGAALLMSARGGAPAALAFPAAIGLSLAHAGLQSRLRRRRARLSDAVERKLGRNEEPSLARLVLRALAGQCALTGLVLAAGIFLRPVLLAAWAALSGGPRGALETAYALSSWAGAAALLLNFSWSL